MTETKHRTSTKEYRPHMHRAVLLVACAWSYLVLLVLVWGVIWFSGDRWWFGTVLLYGPRSVYGLPLLVLLPAATVWNHRLLWPLAAAVLIKLSPIMGLNLPLASLRTPQGPPLTVLTCHVDLDHYCVPALSEAIVKAQPDFVVLQECDDRDQLAALAGYFVVRRRQLAVASRWPLQVDDDFSERLLLRRFPEQDLLACKVETPYGPLRICTLHLYTPRFGLTPLLDRNWGLDVSKTELLVADTEFRLEEARTAAAFVEKSSCPTIVAGEFCMPVQSNIFRECWSRWRDAYSDAGWGLGDTARISTGAITHYHRVDHILFGKELAAARCWVGPDIASHHRPLIAEVRWGKASTLAGPQCEIVANEGRVNDTSRSPRGAQPETASPAAAAPDQYQRLAGCHFAAEAENVWAVPQFNAMEFPSVHGARAIWSATGRDDRGHIWYGVSTSGGLQSPAHLFEFCPESAELIDRGDVISELKRCGIYRPGECQAEIHSRIVQGGDGHLYFTSTDEEGQWENGGRLPTWGSHCWRLRLPENRWEHLFAAPHGLIALAGFGKDIYALGYFGHVLYHYDIDSGQVRSIVVGSVEGHVSRHLVCDHHGHAYVPRVMRRWRDTARVTLVEYDRQLHQIGETPLDHYLDKQFATNASFLGYSVQGYVAVGILAFQTMADRSIIFATSLGYLYRVAPQKDDSATVEEVGWFHPEGNCPTASLFTLDGNRCVFGLVHRNSHREWVVYDLVEKRSKAFQIPEDDSISNADLLCGMQACDNQGDFYLVGTLPSSSPEISPELALALRCVGFESSLWSKQNEAPNRQVPYMFRAHLRTIAP